MRAKRYSSKRKEIDQQLYLDDSMNQNSTQQETFIQG